MEAPFAEWTANLPARAEKAFFGTDEADFEPIARDLPELGEKAGILRCIRHDEIGASERDPIDVAQHGRGRRAPGEAAPIVDERLRKRDEGIEDERPATCDPPRHRHVEVARIADDHRVKALPAPPQDEPGLRQTHLERRAETERPLVPLPFPDARVPLDHLDASPAQTRDHLGVARIVPLIGTEVQDAHSES